MLGLGETLARRRGLLRAMKSLRGLEDYYRLAGGTGSGAEQSRLLTRFRPRREYFIGSGCVRLLFVWAVAVRQRLALDCFGRFVPCTPQAPRMSSLYSYD